MGARKKSGKGLECRCFYLYTLDVQCCCRKSYKLWFGTAAGSQALSHQSVRSMFPAIRADMGQACGLIQVHSRHHWSIRPLLCWASIRSGHPLYTTLQATIPINHSWPMIWNPFNFLSVSVLVANLSYIYIKCSPVFKPRTSSQAPLSLHMTSTSTLQSGALIRSHQVTFPPPNYLPASLLPSPTIGEEVPFSIPGHILYLSSGPHLSCLLGNLG